MVTPFVSEADFRFYTTPSSPNMATKIDPRQICTDLGTQIRIDWNDEAVKEYAELIELGVQLPPILVFYDERNHRFILADGFHRLAAHLRVRPNDLILVEVQLGDLEAARWAAIQANHSHGIRRTKNDKHNAIKQALMHSNGVNLSDRQIAKIAGVHHVTVGTVRQKMVLTGEINQSALRVGLDGRTINTAGINANRNKTGLPKPTYGINVSRINFGRRAIPNGATCGQCRYFEDQKCLTDEIENLDPEVDVCDGFEIRGVAAPPEVISPPDYENDRPLGRKRNRKRQRRLFQEHNLKDYIAVHLPSNNAQLFAVELREHWPKPYLIECLVALRNLLEDDECLDEVYEEEEYEEEGEDD